MRKTLLGRALAVVVTLAATVGAPTVVDAHPLHSTIAEVVEDHAHGTVRATVRVFLDDFTTAVQKRSRSPVTIASGPQWDAAALAYAVAAFTVTDNSGRAVVLRTCGVRRTSDLLWICLESSTPAGRTLMVRNSFLCELFDDQVNVVQATVAGARRSLLFTRGDKAKPLS
ncbi:MAG: DUF6702 family protein [bacterium]